MPVLTYLAALHRQTAILNGFTLYSKCRERRGYTPLTAPWNGVHFRRKEHKLFLTLKSSKIMFPAIMYLKWINLGVFYYLRPLKSVFIIIFMLVAFEAGILKPIYSLDV